MHTEHPEEWKQEDPTKPNFTLGDIVLTEVRLCFKFVLYSESNSHHTKGTHQGVRRLFLSERRNEHWQPQNEPWSYFFHSIHKISHRIALESVIFSDAQSLYFHWMFHSARTSIAIWNRLRNRRDFLTKNRGASLDSFPSWENPSVLH